MLENLMVFIKAGSLRSKPGFGHAMKLSYNTIDKSLLSIGPNKELTYCYRFCNHVPKPSVGLFTAIMDELTTNAVFVVGNPSPPGVSLHLETELFHNDDFDNLTEVDVVSKVTKLGRIVAYTQSDFISNGKLLAQGSHIKYIPAADPITTWIMSNKFAFSTMNKFLLASKPLATYTEKNMVKEVIRANLDLNGTSGRATFRGTQEHTNPFGSMHGGCHAMIMEEVAMVFAKAEMNAEDVILEAMQVDYLKEAKGTVEVVTKKLTQDAGNSLHVEVLIQECGTGKPLSKGKLRFVAKKLRSRL